VIGNDILTSLKTIRGLRSVAINGVSPAHAAEMKSAMESLTLAEDLFGMHMALRE
jgi:hypothetical protein